MSTGDLPSSPQGIAWEELWAPYDETTYQAVLSAIQPQDTLLEIGAGDLRLAWRMAKIAVQVYAIEIQKSLLEKATHLSNLPENLTVILADARSIAFPNGITAAVLLMRHCTHFDLYVQKLMAVGCERLITNARWGNGMEVIDLTAPRQPFDDLEIGWYACLCGTAGFKTGLPEQLSLGWINNVTEVSSCPHCMATQSKDSLWNVFEGSEPVPYLPEISPEIKTIYLEGA